MTHRHMPGPVAPLATRRLALQPLFLADVELRAEGLLGRWQKRNADATIPHCIEEVEESGAVDNVRRLVGLSEAEFSGFQFADSDIYKTLEAAAWATAVGPNPVLDEYIHSMAELLSKAQAPDGYLDSRFQGTDPDQRWTDLAWGHEMYCAGHLVQAAVAAARTGHPDLLPIARRLADLLVRRFGDGGVDGVCGHPEVETAMVELYRLTGESAYLALASRQLELRGRGLLGETSFGRQYFLDHRPIREAREANGHAVRQLYLAVGVTDVYIETGDKSLLETMEALWGDAFARKVYLTGGFGSRHRDESIGDAYELPSDRAYAESCATIASFMWNWRLLLATGRGRYADAMETALYNGIAAAVDESGTAFFYSNPLQLRPGHDGSNEDAPSVRLPWYRIACCPPNLARLFASLQHYVATMDRDGVQLHMYGSSRVLAHGPWGEVELEEGTDYPWDGRIRIRVVRGRGQWALSLRIPSWCDSARLTVDGEDRPVEADPSGYVRISRSWTEDSEVVLDLAMPVRMVRADDRVDAVRGCGALVRGPLVYCVEGCDVEGGSIDEIRLDGRRLPEPMAAESGTAATVRLGGSARFAHNPEDGCLYHYADTETAARVTEGRFTAIPYFAWANRGAGSMRVWLPLNNGA